MIREIELKEALKRHHDGKRCLVWIGGEEGISVAPFESVLEKLRFVVDEEPASKEPAKKKHPCRQAQNGRYREDPGT